MKKILLCDDEHYILTAAEIKLRRANFEVRTGRDGEEGWGILQEWMPDVLVTDCQMPHLDGLGLAVRCRDHEHTRDLPILMLTVKGYELSQDQLRDELGILGVMLKPFSPRELLHCVEQIIETGVFKPPRTYV